MKIVNWSQLGRFKRQAVLILGVLCVAMWATLPARADSELVAEAISKVQEKPSSEGTWQVTANVKFSSEKSGMMVANGIINLDPDADDTLKGVIPMQVGDDESSKNTNALSLVVKTDGTVSIQWLIAGKPFLGRPALVFEANAFPDHLSKKLDWGGAVRRMNLTLTTQRFKPPRIRVPKGAPPQIHVPKGKEPIGKRYRLTGRLVVTNSEDGVLDNTCEIQGILRYHQQAQGDGGSLPEKPCVTIITQDANKGFTLNFDKNIFLDDIFAKPETKYFQIRSSIYDKDSGGGPYDDPMSVGKTRLRSMASAAEIGNEFNLPGDRDSENVEVYYTVTFVEDLY